MKIVADTSGWYAFLVEKDKYHARAKRFLSRDDHELVFTTAVFIEASGLLHARQGKSIAAKGGAIAQRLGLYTPSKKEHDMAWQLFEQTAKKVSFVDCVVVVTAKQLNVPVFTFDRHFSALGVEVEPK